VQKYAETLEVLPPIEINQHDELIDGWHRWTAHKKENEEEIEVVVTETASDTHLLELAIERNAKFGLQLSQSDKRDMARRIYHVTPVAERDEKRTHLADILSVSERTVRDWLSRIDKDTKAARNKRIFDLWLACWTQQEIADDVGMTRATLSTDESFAEIGNIAKLSKTDQSAADHATDFDPPLYNVWKQQIKTAGSSHFGNSESRWLDNLLYLYTKPFDVVIDPFAGGGSTIDVCKKRLRRYLVSDRKPIIEREDIRKHDVTTGLLKPPQWKDVKLVYLDPPYWKQAAGKYSDDAEDLANMALEEFTNSVASVVMGYARKIDGHIAMIMGPTQYPAEDHKYTDHVAHLLRKINLLVAMRISVPYESQQYGAVHVEWAKEQGTILVLTREIVVWKTRGKVNGVFV